MKLCMKCRWAVPVKVTEKYVEWECLKSEKLSEKEAEEFMTEEMKECKQWRKILRG